MRSPDPLPAHALLFEHQAFLHRLARSLVADPQSAEDLAQDVALLALRHPPRPTGSVRAWFARVLRNRAVSVARSEGRRSAHEALVPPPEPPRTPLEIEAHFQVQRRVVEAVQSLEEPYRGVILLRYDQDLPPSAIAERLGVPLSTVKTRLARGLARLRKDLDEHDVHGMPAWSVVLLGGLSESQRTTVTTALAAGGAVMAVKLVWTGSIVAVGVLAGTWWMLREPLVPGAHDLLAAADSTAPVQLASKSDAGSTAPDPVSPQARTAIVERPMATAPSSVSPNWSLVVMMSGFGQGEQGTARVEVDTVSSPAISVSSELPLRSNWTLDLDSLFEESAARPTRLRLRVDHPSFLPAELSLLVPPEWANPAVESGRLEAELELVEPKAVITGEVRFPDWIPEGPVLVAIHAFDRGRPREEPVERITLDDSRRFRLRANAADRHVVVAYVERPRINPFHVTTGDRLLRPTSETLDLMPGETRELLPMDLSAGLAIAGRVDGDRSLALTIHCQPEGSELRRIDQLTWVGDRFENGSIELDCGEDRTFKIGGLGPRAYELHVSPRPNWGGAKAYFSFNRTVDTSASATAPAEGVVLRFDQVRVELEVLAGGRPVPSAWVGFFFDEALAAEGQPSATTMADEDGRLLLIIDGRQGLRVRVSDARFGTKEVQFDPAELLPGARLPIEFDSIPIEPATLNVIFEGDVDALGTPESIIFTTFECSAWTETDVSRALGRTLLDEQTFPSRNEPPFFLFGGVWDPNASTWRFADLRPGRYLVCARRSPNQAEASKLVLGTAFVVDLPEGGSVHHTWKAELGGVVRIQVTGTGDLATSLLGGDLLDRNDEELPVYFRDSKGSGTSLSHTGAFEVLPPLPAGEYVLKLRLRNKGTRTIGFRVDAGLTTDLHVDLADL